MIAWKGEPHFHGGYHINVHGTYIELTGQVGDDSLEGRNRFLRADNSFISFATHFHGGLPNKCAWYIHKIDRPSM
jgi:hypothetical protein